MLSYSEGGRTRFLMLAAHEVVAVRAAVERYRAALAKLEAEGEADRAALAHRLGTGFGLGVDGSGDRSGVTQDLTDLRQAPAGAQHLGRGRVPQTMRVHPGQASPLAASDDDHGDPGGR